MRLDDEIWLQRDLVVGPQQVLVLRLLEAVLVEHIQEEDPDQVLEKGFSCDLMPEEARRVSSLT